MDIRTRKFHATVEEIFHEGGPRAVRPLRRAALLAVIHNPYAGRYEPDILPMMEALNDLGVEMAGRLVTMLGGDPKAVEGYGKGAIVGAAGELEHGALWHVARRLCHAPRAGRCQGHRALGQEGRARPAAISTCRSPISTPAMCAAISTPWRWGSPTRPAEDELLLALVMTTGPRIHARVGGLKASEIKGEDGLR